MLVFLPGPSLFADSVSECFSGEYNPDKAISQRNSGKRVPKTDEKEAGVEEVAEDEVEDEDVADDEVEDEDEDVVEDEAIVVPKQSSAQATTGPIICWKSAEVFNCF